MTRINATKRFQKFRGMNSTPWSELSRNLSKNTELNKRDIYDSSSIDKLGQIDVNRSEELWPLYDSYLVKNKSEKVAAFIFCFINFHTFTSFYIYFSIRKKKIFQQESRKRYGKYEIGQKNGKITKKKKFIPTGANCEISNEVFVLFLFVNNFFIFHFC